MKKYTIFMFHLLHSDHSRILIRSNNARLFRFTQLAVEAFHARFIASVDFGFL